MLIPDSAEFQLDKLPIDLELGDVQRFRYH